MKTIIYSVLLEEKLTDEIEDKIIDILEDRVHEDSDYKCVDFLYKPKKSQIEKLKALGIDFKINKVNLSNGNVERVEN